MNAAFLIVVVIYELELKHSQTLQTLFKIQSINADLPDILVYDNSLQSKYSGEFVRQIAYYKHDPDNSGVGGAYNYAAKLCKTVKKDWLFLYDQDTNVNSEYFKEFCISLKRFPAGQLFCPIVRANEKIISPSLYFAKKTFLLKQAKVGALPSRNYTLINSGMAISVEQLFALKGYDKDLPLDYSDHYFFWKYKKLNISFFVINCENLHSLSSNSDDHFDTVYGRFKMYCLSTAIFSRKVNSSFPIVWLILRTIKLTLKFGRIEFIKFLFFKK